MSLALVYLARGAGNGLASAEGFFEAYRAHPPGCPHELIVIAKGWSEIEGRDMLERMAKEHAASIIDLPDDGYDWGAYMRLAPHLSHKWICFLNTHSRPLAAGWLNLMLKHVQSTGVGAVGATASWGTMIPTWPSLKPRWEWRLLHYPIRLARNAFIFAMNVRHFPYFPNPHLRSNAFLVRRKLFNEFVQIRDIPHNKRDAHRLESGKIGFTRYLINRGLTPLVVGLNGMSYEPLQWISSDTFRVPHQHNLLISDNQTMAYEKANQNLKRRLEISAWGQSFPFTFSKLGNETTL